MPDNFYVNSGLFDFCPVGNLTVPVDNARQVGNVYTDGNALFANYAKSKTFDLDYVSWTAHTGKSYRDKLTRLLGQHIGDGPHTDVIFAAITIDNPQGAQYYKQELVVYGSYEAGALQHVTGQSLGDFLDYFEATVAITRISRRVFNTPTDIPQVEDLQVTGVSTNFFVPVEGNIALERLYYFLGKGWFCMGEAHYGTKYYFSFGFYNELERIWDTSEPKDYNSGFACVGLDVDFLKTKFGGTFEPEEEDDPNEQDPDGPSGPGGGEGDHDQPDDPIPVPPLPTIGPNSAGFVYMLELTPEQMQYFASDMLNPTIWQAIKNFFADPMDFICGIMIVPYVPVTQWSVYPKFGENVFEHAYPQVFQQYTELDFGSIYLSRYFDSCFDQNPYTDLLLWLPYIGYRKLDADECIGKNINIKYHCDCMTGDCVAFITTFGGETAARVVAQFSGNCGVRVPFGSNSYDAAVAASIQLMGGAVGAIAGGALAGPAGIAAGEISASQIANSIQGCTMAAVVASKSSNERSGVAGASAGYLSIQYPYLLRTVPRQSLPANYKQLEGYPSNIAGPLSLFSGFAAVETIDLNGLAATSEEINEIKQLLKGGVFI